MLERLFDLEGHGTSVRTEVLAGLITFLTMAYIAFVNPAHPGRRRYGLRGRVRRDRCGGRIRHPGHGRIRQLSQRAGPRHGPQRFFAYGVVLGTGHSWQTTLAGKYNDCLPAVMVVTILFVFKFALL